MTGPISRSLRQVIHPGAPPHPHRASAGPACHFVGVAVPAMQHGGGSKLKGLMGHAPYPHADGTFRPIDRPGSANGAALKGPCPCG